MTLILFLLGLLLLAAGAELLVRGASRLAAAMGVSPLVIGLTVVAFATSAPEMAVGVRAALTGPPAPILPWATSSGATSSTSCSCWESRPSSPRSA